MRIIEIQALDNGAHRNQTTTSTAIPTGWAVIPEDIPIPATFPFVTLTLDGQTVIAMDPGEVPEPEPEPEPEPTETERLRADVDFLAAMAGVTL